MRALRMVNFIFIFIKGNVVIGLRYRWFSPAHGCANPIPEFMASRVVFDQEPQPIFLIFRGFHLAPSAFSPTPNPAPGKFEMVPQKAGSGTCSSVAQTATAAGLIR